MTHQQNNEKLKPEWNVQIPVQVFMHSEIDAYTLKVFAYMKFRYQFFKKKGLHFTESNSTIAEATSMSRSKVIDAIGKLIALGFLLKQERFGKGSEKKNQTNIYTVMDVLTPNGVVTQQEKKAKVTPRATPKPKVVVAEREWFDDDDSDPFSGL